jgi:hypothetical protein
VNGHDSERVDDDILRALASDGQRAAPAAARARVLARLGVAAAAGTAALAGASSAALGKAATHSVAPATGSLFGFGLAKVLVAHPIAGIVATLAVGSGVGIGAYQAFEPARRPTPAAAAPQATQKPHAARAPDRAAQKNAVISGTSAPIAAAPAVAMPEVAAAAPAPVSPEPAAAARAPDAPKGVAPPASVRDETPSAGAKLSPAPDLPAARSARLAEQQTLLDQARASLRRGDGAGALAIVSGHESLYPVTEFAEERGAIRILSLVMTGAHDEAARSAERFAKRYPTSLFLPSIHSALGRDAVRPNGPETH